MRYLPLALAFVIAGCDSITGPLSPGFEFRSSVVFGVRRSPPVVTGGEGAIDLAGLFEAPNSAYTVIGLLDAPDIGRLQVRIRGSQIAEGVQFPTLHFYQSRVSRLPKGTYDLAITYVLLRATQTDSTVIWTGAVTVR